jgi:hypothetical protein
VISYKKFASSTLGISTGRYNFLHRDQKQPLGSTAIASVVKPDENGIFHNAILKMLPTNIRQLTKQDLETTFTHHNMINDEH